MSGCENIGGCFFSKKKKPLSMMEGEKKLGLKAGGGGNQRFYREWAVIDGYHILAPRFLRNSLKSRLGCLNSGPVRGEIGP